VVEASNTRCRHKRINTFVIKYDGKRQLGRRRRMREGVRWIHVAQDRDRRLSRVYTVLNFRKQQNAGNSGCYAMSSVYDCPSQTKSLLRHCIVNLV
jgi:hypothetical protein